jgi:hypothetical protein
MEHDENDVTKNEIARKPENEVCNLDGFDGYTDEVESADNADEALPQHAHQRVIQGTQISFDYKKSMWVDENGQPLPPERPYIVARIRRLVQKWTPDNKLDGPPQEIGPNQKWPDVEAMNEKRPKSEWRMYFDQLVGPYQRQSMVYLRDPHTWAIFTWAASNPSAMSCVSDLTEQTKWNRGATKEKSAHPVIKLTSRLWSRKYGTPGPYYTILTWIAWNEKGELVVVPPATIIRPTQETLKQLPGGQVIKPLSAKEVLDDELRY